MGARERVRGWLVVLGVVAIFLAFMPYFRYQGGITPTRAQADHLMANPGDMPFTEDYVFGWHGSPLVHYHSELALKESARGGVTASRSKRMSVGWVSWSSLTLAAGVGLLWAAKRLKPAAKAPEAVS